jgi:hypothetical protein
VFLAQFRIWLSLAAFESFGCGLRFSADLGPYSFNFKIKLYHVQVEKLIKELPSVPADWSNGDVNLAERNSMSNGASAPLVENGTNLRETQSMLLERIASEMNRLKFYIAHAQVFFALPQV